MKLLKYSIISVVVALSAVSCNFLNVDSYFSETMLPDSVFANKRNLEGYLWNIPTMFKNQGAFIGHNETPGVLATDEAFSTGPINTSEYIGLAYVMGDINADNAGEFNTWSQMYKVIRKANTVLARMNEADDLTAFEAIEVAAYARMMRAYAYYQIVIDYGPVVLLGDDILESNLDGEEYNMSRATYDESVDYICRELELAARDLPAAVSIAEFGRPTRGAALALVARLRLIQASPLYNGGSAARSYFGNWTRTLDGQHYVAQEYDEAKWAMAAATAKRIIDMNIYSLYTQPVLPDSPIPAANVPMDAFPNGAGGIDIFRSYNYMFNGEAIAQQNAEIIWGEGSSSEGGIGTIQEYTRHSFPHAQTGWNQMALTQKMVDGFYMADGGTITEPGPIYTYNDPASKLQSDSIFSGYTLKANVNPIFINREMRLYANVGFSGRFWPMTSSVETKDRNLTISNEFGGNNGRSIVASSENSDRYLATGTTVVKYIHPDDSWADNGGKGRRIPKSVAAIRYAEILLSYVEAVNHLTQSYTFVTDSNNSLIPFDPATTEDGEPPVNSITVSRNTADMASYFNQIRYRVGLPGLTNDQLASVGTMQSVIERERMIEFLFENRRYYDIRRWGQYLESEGDFFKGFTINGDGDAFFKTQNIDHSRARNRVVDKRMVLIPISRAEVRKVPLLDQNPGWGD